MKKLILITALYTHYQIFASTENQISSSGERRTLLSPVALETPPVLDALLLKEQEIDIQKQALKNQAIFCNEMLRLKRIEIESNPCYKVTRCYYCLYSPLAYCFGDRCDICQCCK